MEYWSIADLPISGAHSEIQHSITPSLHHHVLETAQFRASGTNFTSKQS